MGEITLADIDQAEAALRDAKDSGDPDQRREASQALNELREAFRTQETAAGRRSGFVATEDGV